MRPATSDIKTRDIDRLLALLGEGWNAEKSGSLHCWVLLKRGLIYCSADSRDGLFKAFADGGKGFKPLYPFGSPFNIPATLDSASEEELRLKMAIMEKGS